ncbi:ribonuclease P protein component [Methyloradius palustris]|uniref:ribonuclease P protein component n=1 Tax=Methyloradius palustris TaxID=2778876 RepID=UPI001C8B8DB8|nr:ribonuclease P protein component [Methyloradius palustris]
MQALKFTFPRQRRLIKTDDFSSVFNFRKRISGHYLAIHYQYNQQLDARLGLIVGKKIARLSVDRNYMKRVIKEFFRLNQHQLPNLDLVIRAQRRFSTSDYKILVLELNELFASLSRRLNYQIKEQITESSVSH